MKNKLVSWHESLGLPFVVLDSSEYLEAKQRAADHFEDCTVCTHGDGGKICPAAENLMQALHAAMNACVKKAKQ